MTLQRHIRAFRKTGHCYESSASSYFWGYCERRNYGPDCEEPRTTKSSLFGVGQIAYLLKNIISRKNAPAVQSEPFFPNVWEKHAQYIFLCVVFLVDRRCPTASGRMLTCQNDVMRRDSWLLWIPAELALDWRFLHTYLFNNIDHIQTIKPGQLKALSSTWPTYDTKSRSSTLSSAYILNELPCSLDCFGFTVLEEGLDPQNILVK